jgi:hypothetical protein
LNWEGIFLEGSSGYMFKIGDRVVLEETNEQYIIVERYFWGLVCLMSIETREFIWAYEKENKIRLLDEE